MNINEMKKEEARIQREFAEYKKKMMDSVLAFNNFMQENDISFIENYPSYLPSFDEVVCDLFDLECRDVYSEDY